MCTEYIIPLFILSRMAPAREVPAPPPARGVRAGPAHGRFNRPGARSTRAAPGQGKAGCNGRDVMRFHCVIISSEGCIVSCLKPVARRGGFGNRGPPRGVMRSDAMNCGPPRVCLGSLSKSIKHRGIPCPDVLTNPVSHEKIGISVLFFSDVDEENRAGYAPTSRAEGGASTSCVDTPRTDPAMPPHQSPPPFFFSLTPTCRRSSPAGAGG